MSTEDADPRFKDIDTWPTIDAVSAITDGQFVALEAVKLAKSQIAAAVDAAKIRLLNTNGRLVYVGAGTSGRIAVQDGVELYPTYGWPWGRLLLLMAGGEAALIQAVENAEDDFDGGHKAIIDAKVTQDDVIIGVAASGRTPYVLGAIAAGKKLGALCLGFANNPKTALLSEADIGILLDTGAEPVAGSTRMKAGTSQKIALNLFSTALMIGLGGVYNGLMVGMKPTNAKLRNRAVRMLCTLTKISEDAALNALLKADYDLKLATLFALGLEDRQQGEKLLKQNNGNLRNAILAYKI